MNVNISPGALPHDDDDVPLYAPQKKVYPQRVSGTFRRIKWGLMASCLAVYYLLPFIRWNRGLGAPSQAVLIDFPNRRFYFFFIELWPQEVYYFTGLLILAAFALFLMNALGGRIWCGYLCPQTVWTDLFYAVERWTEGDRRERIKADASAMTPARLARRVAKHVIWLMIAWWTGGAWVLYFSDAPTLVKDLATFQAPLIAYVWIGILTATTYLLAGYAREQVCVYMCPWPRIQAALTDEWALNVTYKYDRGDPRCSVKKAIDLRALGETVGDCIDCNQCVAVCPMGIDIRDGAQLECINCGLCIDACDDVMRKIGQPRRLIAYDTEANISRRQHGEAARYRFVRPRTVLYAGVLAGVSAVMLLTLTFRHTLDLDVLRDRNPDYVRLADGAVRNAYTLKLMNRGREARTLDLSVSGVKARQVRLIGDGEVVSSVPLRVDADKVRTVRVLVTVARADLSASHGLTFSLAAGGEKREVDAAFVPGAAR